MRRAALGALRAAWGGVQYLIGLALGMVLGFVLLTLVHR